MTTLEEALAKAERNERAVRQEQQLVRRENARGNLAYRIARDIDVQIINKSGEIILVDCKSSDNGVFYIDSKDIIKGLDIAKRYVSMLCHGIIVKFKVDMWFAGTKQRNNRRYIDITEEDRGWSIKCWKTPKKIMTERVKR